ncbi:MAG: DUF4126 domain-containing protein [Candidatus Eisenbacteria bacterium]
MIDVSNSWMIASYAAAGIALAACAGMRAFLPLLVVGIAGRFANFQLSEGYQWLSTDGALVTFGIAVIAETLADKVPILDHALDTAGMIIKPAVGTMVAAAMFVHLSPFHATLLGIAVGGTIATTVGLAKAKVRILSSLTTGTLLNPVLSFVEDVVATVIAAVALIAPFLALAFIAAIVVYAVRRLGRPRRPPPADPGRAGPR